MAFISNFCSLQCACFSTSTNGYFTLFKSSDRIFTQLWIMKIPSNRCYVFTTLWFIEHFDFLHYHHYIYTSQPYLKKHTFLYRNKVIIRLWNVHYTIWQWNCHSESYSITVRLVGRCGCPQSEFFPDLHMAHPVCQ
jgi:hypothetical protein